MRRIHLIIGHHVRALTDWTHASNVIGRLLIGLAAFLMMAMMWTERFLTWDRFLQGGPDLELSLVALVVFLCLILLLAQRSQQAVAVQLAVARLLHGVTAFSCSLRKGMLTWGQSLLRHIPDRTVSAAFSGICFSPLRI